MRAGDTRKGTTNAYLSHLLAVATLVLEHGGSEDQAIAALREALFTGHAKATAPWPGAGRSRRGATLDLDAVRRLLVEAPDLPKADPRGVLSALRVPDGPPTAIVRPC